MGGRGLIRRRRCVSRYRFRRKVDGRIRSQNRQDDLRRFEHIATQRRNDHYVVASGQVGEGKITRRVRGPSFSNITAAYSHTVEPYASAGNSARDREPGWSDG